MNPFNIYIEINNSETRVGRQRQASYIAAMQSASRIRRGHLQLCERRQQPKLGRNDALQSVAVQPAAQGRTRGG
eukprot:7048911-Pyramimonas_sp.AAC.1